MTARKNHFDVGLVCFRVVTACSLVLFTFLVSLGQWSIGPPKNTLTLVRKSEIVVNASSALAVMTTNNNMTTASSSVLPASAAVQNAAPSEEAAVVLPVDVDHSFLVESLQNELKTKEKELKDIRQREQQLGVDLATAQSKLQQQQQQQQQQQELDSAFAAASSPPTPSASLSLSSPITREMIGTWIGNTWIPPQPWAITVPSSCENCIKISLFCGWAIRWDDAVFQPCTVY
jgi:hypothetical protein